MEHDLDPPFEDDEGFRLELESDDGNELHTKRDESDFEELLDQANKEIKITRIFHQQDVDKFFGRYRDIAGKSFPNAGGNLLHTLVEVVRHIDNIEPEHVKLLVIRLARDHPHLLEGPNKDGHNPIFVAIRNAQNRLVDYIVSTVRSEKKPHHAECLDRALRMKAPDKSTCLHVALNKENKVAPETITLLLESASDEALGVEDDLGKTPMHYVVSFRQCTDERVKLISFLIERDLEALSRFKSGTTQTFLDIPDKTGTSVYQEHVKTRTPYVKRFETFLANKQRQATEGPKQDQPEGGRTTDRLAMARESRLQATSREPRSVTISKPVGDRGQDKNAVEDPREALRQMKKAEEARRNAELSTKQAEVDGVGRVDRTRERDQLQNSNPRQNEPSPNTPIKRTNTARFDTPQDPERDRSATRPQATPRKSSNQQELMEELMRNSDGILLSLKLHYMRTRSAEMAIAFLYGSNMDDVQLSFDYDRLPAQMLWEKFEKRFGADSTSGLKFDRVLQYVTFPQVEVHLTGRRADMERDAEFQSGIRSVGILGRRDMSYFFDWLYKKGVRHIIRVSVEDSKETGQKVHSDKAIQDSLARFTIEHLDWNKTDLDPETILHVGSKAEKDPLSDQEPLPGRELKYLTLRWSGSNAVLRAWGELEGLPLLPDLQKIYLYTPHPEKTYDSPDWIRSKVDAFKQRLNKSRREIRETAADDDLRDVDVIPTDTALEEQRKVASRGEPHLTSVPGAVKGVNSHLWLDATARFAREMEPFWRATVDDFLESRQNRGTAGRVEEDVVLALIDDGVDMFDKALTNRILEGKSFDFHDGKVRPPFSSAKGHGTVMASMILRVCPMVKVYPIRLKTYDNPDGKNTIDVGYAAQAIQAALDKKAAIISMSWTLPMVEGKSPAKDRLHAVLQKAADRKVLVFCSAPDEGKFTKLDYPSGPFQDRFFRIGAARANGTVFQWTPEDGITYVLPGVDVIRDQLASNAPFGPPSAKGVTDRVKELKFETGSSVATALAAGLAAMIIYCVKASILALKTANQNKGPIVGSAVQDDDALLITTPEAMKKAFLSLGKLTSNNFIQVWEELDKVSEILKSSRAHGLSPEAKLKCVEEFIEFGRKLMSSAKK